MAATQQPNWRDSGNEPSGRTPSTGNRAWQPGDEPAGDSSLAPSKRGIKRTIALFALIGIAIAFGAVLILLRPNPPACLVLIGSGYETNLLLPPNVHGWNGLIHLEKDVTEAGPGLGRFFSYEKPTKLRRVGEGPIESDETSWNALWEKINIQSYKEKTVVVFLSMHGMADDTEAYLLPNLRSKQALKAFDSSRIKFRDVLDSLIAVKDKKVVLLLDVSHVQSHWPIGMLHNDFVKRLEEKYKNEIEATPHLTVICSASPNQRSWASDELQNTVFSHYVAQGLQGGGHNVKDDVNALTLFKYVKEKVDTWAQTNRARSQTPVLLGGEDRARGMALVHVGESFTEKEPDAVAFPVAKLLPEWNQWKELKADHAPHVHSPHLWRLYQETLLRYEHLTRAGDPTLKTGELKKSLAALYGEITVSRSLDRAYKSLGNSFPMPQVLGFPITEANSDKELLSFLEELRNVLNLKGDNDKEKNKVFERFNNRNVQEKQYIQVRLSRFILHPMDRMTKPERDREQLLLQEIDERFRTVHSPVEVQLLKMLADTAPGADNQNDQIALRVRLLAEEAALSARGEGSTGELYSEAIFRWIREDVEKADQIRRDGEDHLFGDPKTHGERAGKKLKAAEQAYAEVRKQAQHLQEAMALRDDVSAELPYIAGWLALPHPHLNRDAIQAHRFSAELLGNRLKVLNSDLDDPARKLLPNPDTLAQMRAEMNSMREKYRETCETLKIGVGLQQNWHGIDAALTVPPMDVRDVGLRVALLSKQRDISAQLITAKQGQPEAEDLPAIRVDRERKLFQATIKSLHEMLPADKGIVDDKVRDFFFKLPGEILAKAEANVERQELVAAANMCRTIPGAFVDFVKDDLKNRVNPVDQLRKTNMGRLLHWQANRTLEDHWFEPGPNKNTPYYDRAATAYLMSVSHLFEGQLPDALRNEAALLNKKLALAELKVPEFKKRFWTTEAEYTFAFKVEANEDVPAGTPMVWLETPQAKLPWTRKSIDPWKTPGDSYLLDNTRFADAGEMKVRLHAYYRGQHRIEDTTIVRAKPDVIVRHTPALPANTQLAVRMDSNFDYGSISIVIDTSGSMAYKHPSDPKAPEAKGDLKQKNRRFDYAMDALEYLLRRVPDNTELSIFTFDDNVRSPIKTYRPASPWPAPLENPAKVRKGLEVALLDGGSPIADAIVRAMTDGFPRANFKGPKLIVMLTDGADAKPSSIPDVPDRDGRVAQLLKSANADNPDIAVVVVCFIDKTDKLQRGEYYSAEAQFGVVKDFKMKGKFLDVSDGPKLGTRMDEMIRPRVQLLTRGGLDVPKFDKGQPINFLQLEKSLTWTTVSPPGMYKAHVLQTSPNPFIDLEMLPGQKRFLVLNRVDNKLSLKRGVLAYQREVKERQIPLKEDTEWVTSLFENVNRGFKAEQLLVFEKRDIEKDELRVPVPGFTWLELDAVTGAKPDKTLHWWRDWNIPASAYRLEMEGWAQNRFPKVTAWFWPADITQLRQKRELVFTQSRPVGFQAKPDAPLDNNSVIESVEWRFFDVKDAKGFTSKQDCLIVRTRHAAGRPAWVDLNARGPDVGSEHHYFTEAGSCTSFFYGMQRVDNVSLMLMDVADFKNAARSMYFAPDSRIELPALFAPED